MRVLCFSERGLMYVRARQYLYCPFSAEFMPRLCQAKTSEAAHKVLEFAARIRADNTVCQAANLRRIRPESIVKILSMPENIKALESYRRKI